MWVGPPSRGMTGTETVLVTGGRGYVGSYLASALIEDGHDVVTFDTATGAGHLERLGVAGTVRHVDGDVTDAMALARAAREHDVSRIVHLAAVLTEDVRSDQPAATRVNALGANNALEVARLLSDRIDRVVLASSETVYAPGSAYDGPVEEGTLLRPDSTYSAAKRHAECLAGVYREAHDVPAVALRPTGVFGPFRRSFTEFVDLFRGPALGDPVRVRGGGTAVSWLYAKDAADALRRAALAPPDALEHGVYNVRGEVATVAEAAEAVRETVDGATVEVADDEDLDWSAQHLSLSRSRADLGYEVEYDLSRLAREYVEAIRRADEGDGV